MSSSLRPAMRRHAGIILVALAFLALGVTYSVTTPLFEASDELWHYPYVKHLADGRGLPIQQPNPEANVARQEGGQPPLYYLLGALATFWIDTGSAQDVMWANPHAIVGEPLAEGNKNLAIHTDAEGFPYRGVSLAVHLVRFLTVAMGAAVVVLTYLIVLEVFPGRRVLAVGAASAVAFLPQFLFIAGSVDNDALVAALGALTLYLLLRLLRQSSPGWVSFAVPGLSLGLALLTKLSALGLVPLVAVTFVYLAWRDAAWRATVWRGLLVALMAVAVSGWWYLRNWMLYGEPTGLSLHLQIVGTRQVSLGQLWSEIEGMKLSFIAVFGGFNLLAPRWFYKWYDLALLMAGLGLVLALAQGKRWPRPSDAPLLLAVVWAAIVGVSFLRWVALTLGGTGRLLFPALPVLALLFVLGLVSWQPARRAATVVAPLVLGMFLLAVYVPFGVIAPAYARPQLLPPGEEPSPSHPFVAVFGRSIELLGYDVGAGATASEGGRSYPTVRAGTPLRLNLYWRGLRLMERDYSFFVHLFDGQYHTLGEVNSYPGAGAYPTSLWTVGSAFRDRVSVPVVKGVEGPLLAQVELGFYWLPTMERLDAASPGGRPLPTSVRIGTVRLVGAPVNTAGMTRVGASFSNVAKLKGYRVQGGVQPQDGVLIKTPGSEVTLRLFWEALDTTPNDYVVFAHVLKGNTVISQHDADPREGDYPTSAWEAGELVPDDHTLLLPPDLPAGSYEVEVGLYQRATGERLPVSAGGDRVVLFGLTVGE